MSNVEHPGDQAAVAQNGCGYAAAGSAAPAQRADGFARRADLTGNGRTGLSRRDRRFGRRQYGNDFGVMLCNADSAQRQGLANPTDSLAATAGEPRDQ